MDNSLLKYLGLVVGLPLIVAISSCQGGKPDTSEFDATYTKAYDHISDSINFSIAECEKSIELAEATKDPKLLGKSYWLMGYLYDLSDDLLKSMTYYNRAADIYIHLEDYESAVKLLENAGTIALESNAGEVALGRYTERLKCALKLDYLAKANAYYDIALAHKSNNQLDSAHFYNLKVLDIVGIDSLLISNVLNELGQIQFHIDNLDSARLLYKQSLDFDGSPSKRYKTTNNIANTYLKEGDLLSAKLWFRMALNLGGNNLKSNRAVIKPLNGLGKVCYRLNQKDSALYYFKKSVDANMNSRGVLANQSNHANDLFRSTTWDLSVSHQYIEELDSVYASQLVSSFISGQFSDLLNSMTSLTQSETKRSIQLVSANRDKSKLIAQLKSYEQARSKHIMYIAFLLSLTALGIFLGIRRLLKATRIKKELDEDIERLGVTI
ncbi:MAG: tetratricopeptide repeat protein [Cytophagales bacterium]|nr:tetratricopeptide repeat protein [Cytophagales bacterium]